MKSKYQSAIGIGGPRCSLRGALCDTRPHRASLVVAHHAPDRDLVERPEASGAQAARLFEPADAYAGRRHGAVRVGHVQRFPNGSRAFSARVTRDTGGRFSTPEMN